MCAAALRHADLTRFVTQSALREADAVIAEADVVKASDRDFARILDLLDNPPASAMCSPPTSLKQTGSYEQASYAIQDTAEMVARHCGRFLPQDKAAIAGKILNRVWAAA